MEDELEFVGDLSSTITFTYGMCSVLLVATPTKTTNKGIFYLFFLNFYFVYHTLPLFFRLHQSSAINNWQNRPGLAYKN